MVPLLVSVQAMELAWVGLNYLGVERTTTEPAVRSVADIHLSYMPFSHSVATAVAAALCAWLILGNLANVSLFSAAIPGPEQFLAGHPLAVVTLVLAQIVTTLALIGWLANSSDAPAEAVI